jgi:hypothetical protein
MKPTSPLRENFSVFATTPSTSSRFPASLVRFASSRSHTPAVLFFNDSRGSPLFRHVRNAREMTIDEFRKMVLEIPTAIERSHMNHPDFRVAGKIFATLGAPDESWAMVKLTPEQQRAFIEKATKVFKPCRGAWGRQGATNVYLAAAKAGVVRAALDTAARNVARQPETSSRSRGRHSSQQDWH